MLNSNAAKPVALPPGRARLATQPPPTGSIVVTNTIGTVRLACCKAPTVAPDSLAALAEPLDRLVAEGRLQDIPGVGPAIAPRSSAR